MNLHSLKQKFSQSSAARRLSAFVLCMLFAAQLAIIAPLLWLQYQGDLSALVTSEKSHLNRLLDADQQAILANPQLLLSKRVLGVMLTDTAGNVVVTEGEVPKSDVSFDSHLLATERTGSGSYDTLWVLETSKGRVLATVRLNTQPMRNLLVKSLVLCVLAAFLVSLLIAGLTLMLTNRAYIRPLSKFSEKLHASRMESDGGIPKNIEFNETEDLNPLAEEFNSLIDAQRKAARQIKVKQQYLEYAAHHDPLTHLPNRLMFEDALQKTVKEAVKTSSQFVIFLIDLDNFKFFNDQYGHLVGDKMVAEIGNRLNTMIRDIDLAARLDGDEFVVLHKELADQEAVEETARRIMQIATSPYEYRGFTLKAAVSVGISRFPLDVHSGQDEEMMGEEIVNNASVALQEAKSNGKNQYKLFNETMRSRLTARIRLEQDLKLALVEGQFEVYYQPKVNIHTRQITGAEALVRWRHPENGFISPEVFVPVAEEAGMIIELGEWILRTACKETRKIHKLGYDTLNIAVNISAVQFTDGNLLPMVSKALNDTKLAPGSLELEITESAVMHDPEEVINSLHELSRFGMRLAIDDFGTGYSSLAYLKRFPVDTLKIDRAFITDISSDNDDVAIVEAVLGLGKHFNMKVVAEGVEDEEQLKFLQSQGCDIAQGYYISKPMPLDQYLSWIKAWAPGVQGIDDSENVIDITEPKRFGT